MYGLYIHIPYCRSRCRYCDFYTKAGNHTVPDQYIDALLRDFEKYALRGAEGKTQNPSTVYFGGGTPSLLAPRQVATILRRVEPLPGAEVTLEVNPESATPEKLAGYKAAGVNRLSVGVQSARDESLRVLGRLHTAAMAKEALRNARDAGFANITGDIMLALPGYSFAEFDESLALLMEGGCTHVSAYILKIEEGTAFCKNPPPGLPDEDKAADFYLYAARKLRQAGYLQYEVSNFAQPGKKGRHNLIYWTGEDYLGIGPGASSCLLGKRFCFPADTAAFLEDRRQPLQEGVYTKQDYIMLRLRLNAGVSQAELESRFGEGFTQKQLTILENLVPAGLAQKQGDGFALTPKGLLVQNSILARLL